MDTAFYEFLWRIGSGQAVEQTVVHPEGAIIVIGGLCGLGLLAGHYFGPAIRKWFGRANGKQ